MDLWTLEKQGYDPGSAVDDGNRFLIANGYMGVRGTVEEADGRAFAAVNLASLMFLAQVLREMRVSPDNITYAVWVRRLCVGAVAVMLCMQGAFQIGSKARHCFWDGEPESLTAEITETNTRMIEQIRMIAETIKSLFLKTAESFFIFFGASSG